MPRSNRPRRGQSPRSAQAPPLDVERALGGGRRERHPDGEWFVRRLAGSAAGKTYRCPGCDQEILPGVPHVVAWPADEPVGELAGFGGPADRRHWHSPCWAARERRRRR